MRKLSDIDYKSLSNILHKYSNSDESELINIANQIVLGQNSIVDSVKFLSFLIDYSKLVGVNIENLIALLQVENSNKNLTLGELIEFTKKL